MFELDYLQGLQDNIIIDTSEDKPVYLIAIGDKPIYLRLSATSYYLLQQRSQGNSFESIAQTFCQQDRVILPKEIEAAYIKVYSQVREIQQRCGERALPYLVQVPLLSKKIVQKIAAIASFAFYKPTIYTSLALIVIAISIIPKSGFTYSTNLTDFAWSYLLLLGSLLIHEFGHASACARYGVSPSEIGFTIYLIWPAFYTDVNNAWTLDRWQRIVVDSGGIFFQVMAAVIYIFLYQVTHWSPIPLGLMMIFSTCLLNLNPFFKFDGYWLFADAFGITNLDLAKVKIIRYLLGTLCHQKVQPLPWSPVILTILGIYTILSFIIWGYLLIAVSSIFPNTLLHYPEILSSIGTDIMSGVPVLGTQKLQLFLTSTFILLIVSLILIRFIKWICHRRIRYFSRKQSNNSSVVGESKQPL